MRVTFVGATIVWGKFIRIKVKNFISNRNTSTTLAKLLYPSSGIDTQLKERLQK